MGFFLMNGTAVTNHLPSSHQNVIPLMVFEAWHPWHWGYTWAPKQYGVTKTLWCLVAPVSTAKKPWSHFNTLTHHFLISSFVPFYFLENPLQIHFYRNCRSNSASFVLSKATQSCNVNVLSEVKEPENFLFPPPPQ